jgi:hypothetical protein
MDNKTLILISTSIIGLSILILGISIYFSSQKISVSPLSNGTLENCSILVESGKNAINLVFISDKENAEKFSSFLRSISPFNNYSSFNIYYIPDYKPKCEIYKGVALLCYSKEILKKAASCPNDYIIVIQKEDPSIRSSEYMGVISINSNHQLTVLPHEFGHAFVNLAEEYTPAEIPQGSKNCQQKCENFNIKDGCYNGCSKDSYFRSIENGIMRTLGSSNYGVFNEQLIIEKLISKQVQKITSNVIYEVQQCKDQEYYLIEGNYSGSQIKVIEKSIESGCTGNGGSGPFTYQLELPNQIISGSEFNPEFIFTDVQLQNESEISGEIYSSDRPFILRIPIIPNSKSIEILKDNQTMSRVLLSDIGARPCEN